MSDQQSHFLSFTRNSKIPLVIRRLVASKLLPYKDQAFSIEIEGVPYEGRRDNYIEWMVYVTQSYFEYIYLLSLIHI